jgi:hypothetical protein
MHLPDSRANTMDERKADCTIPQNGLRDYARGHNPYGTGPAAGAGAAKVDYFLKRSSKAWRASVWRGGAEGVEPGAAGWA